MSQQHLIIRLNRVDLLTLSATLSVSLALWLTLNHKPFSATTILFLAMLADALDGIWARRRGVLREFGRYLDGFMDVLVYLVAPALIWHHTLLTDWSALLLPLLIACGCIRLAVFNQAGTTETPSGKPAYTGMPVFWSLFILAGSLLLNRFVSADIVTAILIVALPAFSFAMLWNRPFFKFTALWQILLLTLGGAALFAALAQHAGEWPW
jgi:CDP-diacylglycerol---serine O-phosphatidyltransferase